MIYINSMVLSFCTLAFHCCFASEGETTGGKPKILITHSEIPRKALDLFGDKYELKISEGSPHPTRETLLNDINGVDAVLWFSLIAVDKEMIDAAGPQLKVVGSMADGYDHIDVKLLKERNIAVSNTPIVSTSVADMAIGLALAVSRNIVEGNKAILSDKWVANHPTWMCGPRLEGATVGIVGFGAIGTKIAKRIKSFDIGDLLYFNLHEKPEAAAETGAKFVTLEELLKESDFVFLAVPLTSGTKFLINMERIKIMKPTSVLINCGRGGVVNEDDLVVALTDKIIWGAALDVMYPEPIPSTHPLTKLPNCVLTPHIGSATIQAREEIAVLTVNNIINALNGKPLLTPIKEE